MNTRKLRLSAGLVGLLLLNFLQVTGQPISMEQTLNYIRQKLGPSIEIEINHGYLVARFKEGGDIYREDQVNCKDLKIESIQYDRENRIFFIECGNKKDCVDRQLVMRRIDRAYGRISFPVTLDAKSEAGLKKAFAHMIRLVTVSKYQSEEPFE